MKASISDELGKKVKHVYCDGHLVHDCFLADEEAGYADSYAKDKDGNYFFTDETRSKLQTTRRYGEVKIEWLKSADAEDVVGDTEEVIGEMDEPAAGFIRRLFKTP